MQSKVYRGVKDLPKEEHETQSPTYDTEKSASKEQSVQVSSEVFSPTNSEFVLSLRAGKSYCREQSSVL